MAFSVNTNLGALQAYNALAKVNADTQAAQVRLLQTKGLIVQQTIHPVGISESN